jgi:hypothetical protein
MPKMNNTEIVKRNNSTNINKMNNRLSPKTLEHKKTPQHFEQYFSYIVASVLLLGKTGENHRPAASH